MPPIITQTTTATAITLAIKLDQDIIYTIKTQSAFRNVSVTAAVSVTGWRCTE